MLDTGHVEPRRYVGLRINGTEDEALGYFKEMDFPNPYFYGVHSPDSGCKNFHVHFVILRDWDPTIDHASNSKKLRRDYANKVKFPKTGMFAFSFYTDTVISAGNYMMHDPDCVIKFSDGYDWKNLDKYGFKWEDRKKEPKPDDDLEKRRRDLDAIPLTMYNLVSTLQRMDRIRKRPKRSFKEALVELLTTTRYRLNKELQQMPHCPRHLIEEYEQGIAVQAKSWVNRWVPY